MKRVVLLFFHFLLFILNDAIAQSDSVRVERLLEQGQKEATAPLHLWYAQQLIGSPYVGQTLEVNKTEQLVVNLRQLDCTTFVETAIALALTQRQGSTRYADYQQNLTKIRYRDGLLNGYPSRNHYFTQWIDSNERLGYVEEKEIPTGLSVPQTLDLHYMSLHPDRYPMLRNDADAQALIRQYEQECEGRVVHYVPHSKLNGYKTGNLSFIQDGDILAIVTKKDGLDTSHIGFAVWGRDNRLHLLNASQIHKKVVLEPMTLFEYMSKHPSQLGVRVIRVRSARRDACVAKRSKKD